MYTNFGMKPIFQIRFDFSMKLNFRIRFDFSMQLNFGIRFNFGIKPVLEKKLSIQRYSSQ